MWYLKKSYFKYPTGVSWCIRLNFKLVDESVLGFVRKLYLLVRTVISRAFELVNIRGQVLEQYNFFKSRTSKFP